MQKIKMLAIDLGASSGRGIIGEFDGERITLRENHRFSNDTVIVNGRMHWDILRIFHEIKQAISKAVLEGEEIRTIGIDTWGVDYALLDKHGRMLSNPIHYRDVRTEGIMDHIEKNFFTLDELYSEAGIQHMNFNTIFQLAADLRDEPEKMELAERMLNIPDLLNYFLTGNMANEYTILSTGALLDANTRTYSYRFTDKLGVPRKLFGEIVQPGYVVGGLLPQVQGETGKTDAKVITVASHDTASAVVAVPTQEEEFIYISSGTWSLMGTELNAPMLDDASRKLNFTNEGGAMGKIRYLKNIMGLWLIQESRRQWKREGKDYSFAQMEAWAKEATPFRSFIDPDDASFATPGDMPGKIREFCRRTNQPVPETVGEIVRCIYQSLALKYRKTAESIETIIGKDIRTIHVVGGGTKDHFLSQMTADACNMQVIAGPEEATAIGNLMMQAIAAGAVSSLAEARKIVAASFDVKTYAPSADRAAWDQAYQRFLALN